MDGDLKLGLIGEGIGRTRSGDLHRLLGELAGRATSYELIDLEDRAGPVDLAALLADCRARGFRGVNVTHPYKQVAFGLVRLLRDLPSGLDSINTVCFEPAGDFGDNTDHSGFCRAFRERFGEARGPGRVLQLGAGGVGVALAFGLAELGAEEIVLADNRTEPARRLVTALCAAGYRARLAGPDLEAEMSAVEGLVNATPVGMAQYPGNPFPAGGLGGQAWAFDAVYTPLSTEFLQTAEAAGLEILSGFELFFHQGLDAFARFDGRPVEAAQARAAFLARHPLGDGT